MTIQRTFKMTAICASVLKAAGGGGGGLSPVEKDLYVDSDGTLLSAHTPDIGGPWTIAAGSPTINSNTLTVAVGDIAYTDFGGECCIESTKSTTGTAQQNNLMLRFVDADNLVQLNNLSTGRRASIVERTAGVETTRATSGFQGYGSDWWFSDDLTTLRGGANRAAASVAWSSTVHSSSSKCGLRGLFASMVHTGFYGVASADHTSLPV